MMRNEQTKALVLVAEALKGDSEVLEVSQNRLAWLGFKTEMGPFFIMNIITRLGSVV